MVADANVFVRLVIPGEYRPQAFALWDQVSAGHELCVVPAFCPAEVISSIRQTGRAGMITPEEEDSAVRDFVTRIRPGLTAIDSPALTLAAWEIARDLNERHAYDSVYLAAARGFGMEFWTTDQKLLRLLAGRFPEARFLGDYPLPPPAP